MRNITLLLCSALLLTGCIIKMAPQVKAKLTKLEVRTADSSLPKTVKMCVRYDDKQITIDTQQPITDPFSVKQPKSWIWVVVWPTVAKPLTEGQRLDGFTIYESGYRPEWCGWKILNQKSASITLTKDPDASSAFDSFIINNIGKSTTIPGELKAYFNLGDGFNENVIIK